MYRPVRSGPCHRVQTEAALASDKNSINNSNNNSNYNNIAKWMRARFTSGGTVRWADGVAVGRGGGERVWAAPGPGEGQG